MINEIRMFSPKRCSRSPNRQMFGLGDRLEAVTRHDPRKLLGSARFRAGRGVAAYYGDVGEFGPRRRESLQVRGAKSRLPAAFGAPMRSSPRSSGYRRESARSRSAAGQCADPACTRVPSRRTSDLPTRADIKAKHAGRILGVFKYLPGGGASRASSTATASASQRRLRRDRDRPLCGIPHRHLAGLRLPQPRQQLYRPGESCQLATYYNRISARHARPKSLFPMPPSSRRPFQAASSP